MNIELSPILQAYTLKLADTFTKWVFLKTIVKEWFWKPHHPETIPDKFVWIWPSFLSDGVILKWFLVKIGLFCIINKYHQNYKFKRKTCNIYIYIYVWIFVLPSTGFEPTPLIHCSTIRLALRPAPQTTRPHLQFNVEIWALYGNFYF